MKNVWIALFLGALSSCLSYVFLKLTMNLALAFAFNPFIVCYLEFDASGVNPVVANIIVGTLNLIPFLFFGMLSNCIRKWAFGPWLFGVSILIYLGWIISHLI